MPIAPTAAMINPLSPICDGAVSAATPPATSMTAAATCVGATARSTRSFTSMPPRRASVHHPEPPIRTASNRLSTAPITMKLTIRAGPNRYLPGTGSIFRELELELPLALALELALELELALRVLRRVLASPMVR